MFTPPLYFCPHMKKYVALDQTQAQCATECSCQLAPCLCAAARYFFKDASHSAIPPAVTAELESDAIGLTAQNRDAVSELRPTLSITAQRVLQLYTAGVRSQCSGSDFRALLRDSDDDIEAAVQNLVSHGLLSVAYSMADDQGYALTADGTRYAERIGARLARIK